MVNITGDVVGILLTITGIFDAYKYHWEARSIKKVGTAKGHSRKFINAAIINDVTRLFYLTFFNQDIFLLISTVIAIFCMSEMFYMIYKYYPYRRRNQEYFKRPNIILYTLNSLLPNKLRKHL